MQMKQKSLMQLFLPICLETLCYMLAGTVDTLMLSSVGDQAVGAVGTSNTYISMFIIMFSIISSGMIAVMTQYIGAEKPGVAYQARQLRLLFNVIIGITMSLVLSFGAKRILQTVGIADSLSEYATTYLRIIGAGFLLNATIPIFSSYLRAFGHTKYPLVASLCSNAINLVLNALFLFVFHYGVAGVAVATVISRLFNLLVVVLASHKKITAHQDPQRLPNLLVMKQIIQVGLPSALESGLYNIAMTLVIRFLNQMDAEGINVTARSYVSQITNFSYSVGAALAQANAIMTGWRIGAGKFAECDRATKKAAVVGIGLAAVIGFAIACSSRWFMGLFTEDTEMQQLVRTLMFLDIGLEMGRVGNLVFGQALKTSGDALFTTVLGLIFMYLCAVCGTWLLGLQLGLLAVGAYIAMASDECIRAFCMFLRWNSGKWREKGFLRQTRQ